MSRGACICIPARNEVDRLPVLLDALAAQDSADLICVALCINNSDDGSAEVVRATVDHHRRRLRIAVDEVHFPAPLAHAGSARRHAMAMGVSALGGRPDSLLISTDADCRPPPGWVRANLDAFTDDNAIVGGRIVIDDRESLPPPVASLRADWDRYWAEVRRIEDAIDPRPWDAPPRHGDHTGASLAMTVGLYRASGGVPVIPSGEDRALVEAAIIAGGRLRHPITVWTRVSPRQVGRAAGGMADNMRKLHDGSVQRKGPMAPGFDHWRARALWRRQMRSLPDSDRHIAEEEPKLPAMPHDIELGTAG